MKKQCPCCKKKNIKNFLFAKKFPYFTTPISISSKKKIKEKNFKNYFDDLDYASCKHCEHIFLKKNPSFRIINELYKKFYAYPSAMLGEFVPSRDNSFVKFLKKYLTNNNTNKKSSFYEIGCYDGYILYQLKKMGFKNLSGCDPSNGSNIAKRFGLNVKREFFEIKNDKVQKFKYDFVIARHLVEHLKNPKKFFIDLKKITHLKSKIIIEVPNGEFYLKKGLVEVFSHQHIHLFNKFSMYSLIKNTSLFIEKTAQVGGNIYFILSYKTNLKKLTKGNLVNQFLKNYNYKVKKISDYLKKNKERKTLFYGAGGFCCAAIHLYKININKIYKILDSDTNKTNKEFLDIDIKVQSGSTKLVHNNLVIITSYYTKDILNLLVKRKMTRNVMIIHPEVKLKRIN